MIKNASGKKHKIREKIISVSRMLFARYSYKKTTLDDIAGEIGKAKGTIYYYFKNKEEIYKVIIEKEAQIIKEHIDDSIKKYDDPRQQLTAYVINKVKSFTRLANLYKALKVDIKEHYSFLDNFRKKFDKWEMSKVKQILNQGIQKGIFSVENTSFAAGTLVLVMNAIELTFDFKTYEIPSDETIRRTLDFIFNGINTRA